MELRAFYNAKPLNPLNLLQGSQVGFRGLVNTSSEGALIMFKQINRYLPDWFQQISYLPEAIRKIINVLLEGFKAKKLFAGGDPANGSY